MSERSSSTLHVPEGVAPAVWARVAVAEGGRWAIAERNADGETVGTAYRLGDGSKSSAKGGKRGLIISWPLAAYAGSSPLAPIFVCEGASDTAALLGLGLDAVGVPMAGQCGEDLAKLLTGLHTVLVADADEAGRRGMAKIAKAIGGACASVRVIEPPGGAKDARAAVIAGADRAAFEELVRAAPRLPPELPLVDGAPVLQRLSEIEPKPISWLWPGWIPRARLSLLAGRPGEGKSMLTMDLVARLTTGRPWPDGSPSEPGSVILIAGEDDPADTIRPRLDAHGADPQRVVLLRSKVQVVRGDASEVAYTLADVETLRKAIRQAPDTALVVVDPVGSFIGSGVDAHRDNEVRGVLAPLAAMAGETGAGILLVAHVKKGASVHADDAVLGSRAFTGIARAVLHLMIDPDDDQRRLVLPGKMNLAKPPLGRAFTIAGDPPRIAWEQAPVAQTADGVLAAREQGGGRGSGRSERLGEAVAFLRTALSKGPRAVPDVLEEAAAKGISKRTLDRAKKEAGVHVRKASFGSGWEWSLVSPCEPCQPEFDDRQSVDLGVLRGIQGEMPADPPKDANGRDVLGSAEPDRDLELYGDTDEGEAA